MSDRTQFFAAHATSLASAVGVSTPWSPKGKLSEYFRYFADMDRLVVIAAPEKDPGDIDKALAYGLSYAGDRDLWLVLPVGTAEATLDRVAFLDVPVRVFEHSDARLAARVVPSRRAVLARAREGRLATRVHELGRASAWLAPLIAQADAHPDLNPAHRESYLAWHCRGRRVLCITGSEVVAGVAEKAPRFHPAPVRLSLAGAPTDTDLGRACAAVGASVEVRLGGADRAPDEHWLQSTLRDPTVLGFELVHREFPGLRAGHEGWRRAYVDLFGVSRSKRGARLHLVETKLGADEMLVLQGLDYWIWAEANRELLTAHFGVANDTPVQIDFVVDGLGVHSSSQAEALAGDIPWRVRIVRGWFEGDASFDDLPRRSAVRADGSGPRRHTGPRFARQLHLDLAGPRPDAAFLRRAEDGVVPEARPALRDLEARGLVHRFAAHVRSSQAFALNLFGPLGPDGVVALLSDVFGQIRKAEAVAFEFIDDDDRLRERSAASAHTTQVDVMLRGVTQEGVRVAMLVEVKLSEIDFGACTGFNRATDDEAGTCASAGAFGGVPGGCAQLANRGDPSRRRYDAWIAETAPLPEHPGCLFRLGMNQPMRNLALARMLVAEGACDRAAYALCAHDGNAPIWRRWTEVKRAFGDQHGGVSLVELRATRVVAALPAPIRSPVQSRYRL